MPDDRLKLCEYVVLYHDGIDDPHFDLMLERDAGSDLETFRITRWPIAEPAAIVPLGDHRRAYLDYQGPVSGNRGTVTRVEKGRCSRAAGDDGAQKLTLYPTHPGCVQRVVGLRRSGNEWIAEAIRG